MPRKIHQNIPKVQYIRGIVVVHGKSEFLLVRYITTNLHLRIKPVGKDNGKSSIQINGLKNYLSQSEFRSLSSFAKKYGIEYDKRNKCLKNFKLFIIMDTDDCTEEVREQYISGELFKDHVLKDYIVPIYNISNLEDVMKKAGIITK